MNVIKRDGRVEPVQFDKITTRVSRLAYGLDPAHCKPIVVAQKVVQGLYDNVRTCELDELAAETAAALTSTHPDYATLAARIAVSNLHSNTCASFSDTIHKMRLNVNPATGERMPLVSADVHAFVTANAERLNAAIDYASDFEYDFFGFKTLERSYLLKDSTGRVIERPQHMLMRCAVGLHTGDVEAALETYHLLSQRWFTHASPTLFNAGTERPQLSSCYLAPIKSDTIEGRLLEPRNRPEIGGEVRVRHVGIRDVAVALVAPAPRP